MIPIASLLLAAQATTIVIDPAATQGKWEGWGTSLCWMGKMFGDRDDVADILFSTKTVTLGSEQIPGLGMNIVYNVVTGVLGGRITIESTLGAGTTLRMILPRCAPQRNSNNHSGNH